MCWRRCLLAVGLIALLAGNSAAAGDTKVLPLLLHEEFEHGMQCWETTDPPGAPSVWQIVGDISCPTPNCVLRVTGASTYQPPYRSPLSIAWLKDVVVGDFELTVNVQNTNFDAGAHRDLCIFWGNQSPAHFYYAHLGAVRDPNSCQIFIVNDARRTPISDDKDAPLETPWTRGWHKVKVVRDVDTGRIEVYFDDMQTPHMTATDTTFTWGRIGLGTFDDNGNFDELVLRGDLVAPQD